MIGTWSGGKSADSHLTPEVCPFSDKIACLHQKGIANGLSYRRKDVFSKCISVLLEKILFSPHAGASASQILKNKWVRCGCVHTKF